ncbi:hypothetical protein HU200_051691 [Digitaria exilis]|uniref:Uncharacterized protein n=1 Tax=Digitaria exilis TaxID=1010633 RepID=A0A835B0T3_9POAL|nr:hypothetical protein HU200_051691 [Digitaria exilis]
MRATDRLQAVMDKYYAEAPEVGYGTGTFWWMAPSACAAARRPRSSGWRMGPRSTSSRTPTAAAGDPTMPDHRCPPTTQLRRRSYCY